MALYSESHWRNSFAPIIAKVIAENAGKDESAVKLAIRAAYPLYERKHHPYNVWLDEIQVQLGKRPHPAHRRMSPAKKAVVLDDRTGDLFGGAE